MEIRQSLKSGLMAVWALQLQFQRQAAAHLGSHACMVLVGNGAGAIHSWGDVHGDARGPSRFDTTAYYDAITINQTRIPLSYSYPMWNMGWRPMLRVAASSMATARARRTE
jgi:hypothetical protein